MSVSIPKDGSVLEPNVDATADAQPVEPHAPDPDLSKTAEVVESARTRSVGVTVLTVLAVLYTLYFAREFLLPIAFAQLLSFLFSPVVRALARFKIRPPIGAALVILSFLGLSALAVYELSGPVQRYAASAPQTLAMARERLGGVLKPLERASATAQQVQNATVDVGEEKPAEVVMRSPSLISRIFGTTQRFITGTLEVLLLLYFLLAAGDLFLQKLIKVLPNLRDKKKAVEIARKAESSISIYLLTATAMNVAEGLMVAGVLYLLGMPNPLLWGSMVVVLEFIPYLGALFMVAILTIAAITTFDSIPHAMLAPASFLLINIIQANVVSPYLLGHRLALNPVALLVGLTFWFWIWGIPGAFIAVPMLATFKIFCDHIESMAAVGEFLGTRDPDERRAAVR
ncbi:MAG: AI-2E family transporter [Gemmatimonadetes bacterium]|nr:AI-2E family transporter [Gemmatimonadota bacterium]